MNFPNRISLLRVIDANANRAGEGLRVVEEFARFILEDPHLTRLLKQLRHDLTEVLRVVSHVERCAARDTARDVGTGVSTSEEFRRETAHDIALANQKRVEQSLRSLEEFFKPLDSVAAARLEQLRYRAYTIGRSLELTGASRERFHGARLYVLMDGGTSLVEFTTRAQRLVDAGVHVLQLRDKRLEDRELIQRARQLRRLTSDSEALFIMNDRPDIARLAAADGVHVGQDELSVRDVRAIMGPEAMIGVSTHSLEQARQAIVDGANYIGCGPTFPSRTKSFQGFPGLHFLRQVVAEISLPAFAIGGITADNLAEVLETGFWRIAVSGAVADAANPAEAARRMLSQLEANPPRARAGDKPGALLAP